MTSNRQGADTFLYKYMLSCFAATAAETVTFPLDLTKTCLQIQGDTIAKSDALRKRGTASSTNTSGVTLYPRKGMFKTAYDIGSQAGVLKLWQGLAPAVSRHIVYTGCRIGIYEYLRDHVLGKDGDSTFPVWKAAFAGCAAGAVAQFLASPADLIKVQMQTESSRRLLGYPVRVRGSRDALQKIVTRYGLVGLWKGWLPNVQRAALVNLGELATYDTAKRQILNKTNLQDHIFTHALSSMCSGLVATTLSTPADVVKTRMMHQNYDNYGKGTMYQSSLHCLRKTVADEGFSALYKGFLPTWLRLTPWQLTFWITYEQLRKLSGSKSF